MNRELSWLDFNCRVLAIADDAATPALERAKFLAIFSQNLDEFFQVRVAGLHDQVDAGITQLSPDGLSPLQQLQLISEGVREIGQRADRIFLDDLIPALAEAGVRFSSWDQLDGDDQAWLRSEFDRRIYPVLTPLALDPGHPFPYISNLSMNLGVMIFDPDTEETNFARVKVPPLLPRFVVMPDGERFVPVEQVIAAHLHLLFPGLTIVDHVAFRVTRNADLDLEEEGAEDLLAAIEVEVLRRRFGRAVRLEVEAKMSAEVLEVLQRELEVGEQATYRHDGPLDLAGLWGVYALDRPDLKYGQNAGITAKVLTTAFGEPADIFAVLRRGDLMVHHPYESFSTSVEEFIRQASVDPAVLAIKLTLYRTSGASAIVASLIRAAEAGKQVVALVELKARFDEANNIEWARRLEESGVHVVYGLVGLKTHTKVAMVARAEGDAVRCYCHIGTGNYNAKTARTYEDIGLLTASPEIGSDVTHLFNYLTGYGRNVSYDRLLVAPERLRSGLIDLVRNERKVETGGRIVMKMNSLADPEFIDELYAASADGVRIELIVRGICCLRTAVEGLSERIRVRSIVGRYLEHSRIFRFGNGAGLGVPAYYIGSADMMPRNLDRRIEALTSIDDPALQRRLDSMLAACLDDDTLAWDLHDDRWIKCNGRSGHESQVVLQELARAWTRETPTKSGSAATDDGR